MSEVMQAKSTELCTLANRASAIAQWVVALPMHVAREQECLRLPGTGQGLDQCPRGFAERNRARASLRRDKVRAVSPTGSAAVSTNGLRSAAPWESFMDRIGRGARQVLDFLGRTIADSVIPIDRTGSRRQTPDTMPPTPSLSEGPRSCRFRAVLRGAFQRRTVAGQGALPFQPPHATPCKDLPRRELSAGWRRVEPAERPGSHSKPKRNAGHVDKDFLPLPFTRERCFGKEGSMKADSTHAVADVRARYPRPARAGAVRCVGA